MTVYYNESNGVIASTYAEAIEFRWKVDIGAVFGVIGIFCLIFFVAYFIIRAIVGE